MKRLFVLFASACTMLLAQSAPLKQSIPPVSAEMLGKGAAPARTAKHEIMAADAAAPITTSNMVYQAVVTTDATITVQPGQLWLSPQLQLDFSGAARASIAVTSLGTDLTGLRILPAWAADKIWFTLTDISQNFPVLDHGGLSTPVYGPYMKVALYNGSSAPLEVKQLTVYAARNAQ